MISTPVFPGRPFDFALGRHSIRLKGYDYSQAGGYFVTIVAQLRAALFGEIRGGEMILNDAGRMVETVWDTLPARFPNIELDIFQIMPTHFHSIIIIHEPVGAGLVPALALVPAQYLEPIPQSRATTRVAPTLGDIVGAFKSITTHAYIQGVDESNWPQFHKRLWQRNYGACPERNEGNTSSVTNPITNALPVTSPKIRPIGSMTKKIPYIRLFNHETHL